MADVAMTDVALEQQVFHDPQAGCEAHVCKYYLSNHLCRRLKYGSVTAGSRGLGIKISYPTTLSLLLSALS